MFRRSETPTGEPVEFELTIDDPLPPAPISVVTLAAELEEPVGALVHRLAADVFVEPMSGLRCVDVAVCRRLLDQRAQWRRERARAAVERAASAAPPPVLRTASDPALEALAAGRVGA